MAQRKREQINQHRIQYGLFDWNDIIEFSILLSNLWKWTSYISEVNFFCFTKCVNLIIVWWQRSKWTKAANNTKPIHKILTREKKNGKFKQNHVRVCNHFSSLPLKQVIFSMHFPFSCWRFVSSIWWRKKKCILTSRAHCATQCKNIDNGNSQ